MRIISPFTDYYDGIQFALGAADLKHELPVYLRETQKYSVEMCYAGGAGMTEDARVILPALQILGRMPDIQTRSRIGSAPTPYVLVVCGKIYPFYRAHPQDGIWTAGYTWKSLSDFIQSARKYSDGLRADDYRKLIRVLDLEEARPATTKSPWLVFIEDKHGDSSTSYSFSAKGWNKFEDVIKQQTPVDVTGHRHFGKSPVLLITRSNYDRGETGSFTVTSNPQLREYDAARIIDPFTLYQEIDMYLGNQLTEQSDPIPERTQDLIRDAHGFDNKSFRNTKPDRRARKRVSAS